jgi:hypothetical protein
VLEGTLYWVTDENLLERSNGSAWQEACISGEETSIAYDAGLFTATGGGGGTWSVASGDVGLLVYSRVNPSLMLVRYAINTSSITGTPTLLRIELPFTSTGVGLGLGRFLNGTSGVAETIETQIAASSDSLILLRFDVSAWPALTDTAYVVGTTFIPG